MNYARTTCRLCDGSLKRVLELTPTPLANSFPDKPYMGEKYPLNLMQCVSCGHVQGEYVVDAETLYGDYKYVTPPAMQAHWKAYAVKLKRRYPQAKRVLEIGCNDGSMLKELRAVFGFALGVDPAGGPDTLRSLFTEETAKEIRKAQGKFDLIVANNVFAHIDNLQGVFRGVEWLLDKHGSLVFEVQYLPELVRTCAFDTIYHEHHDYHQIGPLQKFVRKFGLEMKRVEKVSTHGGSIRVHCKRAPQSSKVFAEVIDWRGFACAIEAKKQVTLESIYSRIPMFGAPAKATTLIHHFGLQGHITFAADDTPQKQGRYIPGTGIQIRPMNGVQPQTMLLAAWNYADHLKAKYPQFDFIVPGEKRMALAA